jgi:excisionase family DNA binding protein
MINGQWLTVQQIAEALQVDGQTVRRWLRSGELRGVLLSDKAGWRVRPEDLEGFLRSKGWEPGDAGKAAA